MHDALLYEIDGTTLHAETNSTMNQNKYLRGHKCKADCE